MSAGSSAYSPLPQSNSDSDGSSEEELHVSRGNRIINSAAKIQNSACGKGNNEQKNSVINYKPLDNNSDIGIALNKFQSSSDEVSILNPDGSLEIFSTSRKICFVLSLLLCIFTTFAFIWLLPCNVDSCPSASELKNYNFTWEKNLLNLEIYGPISLVSTEKGSQNLVFLTKSYSDFKKNYSENGLMCLTGKDGSLRWKVKFEGKPTDVDCKLIDINADGINDCLIHGRNVLRAVNPISGIEFWDIQKSVKYGGKIYFNDFPLIIPDLNKDDVKELLLPSSFAGGGLGITLQNYLVIISGKTGEIINKPLQINFCSSVKDLTFENDSTLFFTCFKSDEKVPSQKISLTKLYKTLKSVPEGKINGYKWPVPSQHIKDSAVVQLNGFRLNLENQGNCPDNCVVFVDVRDERESSDNKTIFHFSRKNTFGMAPVLLKTKKESGFLLKYWAWHSEAEDFQNDAGFSISKTVLLHDNSKSLIKRSKKLNYLFNNSKILDNEMLSESEWESQRFKRTAATHRMIRSDNSGSFSLHVITENIVKIVLNNTHLVTKDVAKDEILQICRKLGICQPDVYNQRHSVMVADLGNDEGEKLITFSSKYIHDDEKSSKDSEGWHLQSRIRVLNL